MHVCLCLSQPLPKAKCCWCQCMPSEPGRFPLGEQCHKNPWRSQEVLEPLYMPAEQAQINKTSIPPDAVACGEAAAGLPLAQGRVCRRLRQPSTESIVPGPSLPSHGAGPAAPLVLVRGLYFCLYVHFKRERGWF